jgi:hypothetical protein
MAIKQTTELITPAMAAKYLNLNVNNRKATNGTVSKYAQDMVTGKWTVCAMPICFYEDGSVADGQHRLMAVVESGKSQSFFVLRGLPKEAGLNIDTGKGRTLVDAAQISGSDPSLSYTLISTARAYEYGTRGDGNLSNALRMAIIEQHRIACEWAIKHGPTGRGLRNAMVLAAIARAYSHECDEEKLKRYCEVLDSGFSEGAAESSAVAMRNYLLEKGVALSRSNLFRDTFMRVQHSISLFLRGKPVKIIRPVNEEVYPNPYALVQDQMKAEATA